MPEKPIQEVTEGTPTEAANILFGNEANQARRQTYGEFKEDVTAEANAYTDTLIDPLNEQSNYDRAATRGMIVIVAQVDKNTCTWESGGDASPGTFTHPEITIECMGPDPYNSGGSYVIAAGSIDVGVNYYLVPSLDPDPDIYEPINFQNNTADVTCYLARISRGDLDFHEDGVMVIGYNFEGSYTTQYNDVNPNIVTPNYGIVETEINSQKGWVVGVDNAFINTASWSGTNYAYPEIKITTPAKGVYTIGASNKNVAVSSYLLASLSNSAYVPLDPLEDGAVAAYLFVVAASALNFVEDKDANDDPFLKGFIAIGYNHAAVWITDYYVLDSNIPSQKTATLATAAADSTSKSNAAITRSDMFSEMALGYKIYKFITNLLAIGGVTIIPDGIALLLELVKSIRDKNNFALVPCAIKGASVYAMGIDGAVIVLSNTRTGSSTFYDKNGYLQQGGAGQRISYNPTTLEMDGLLIEHAAQNRVLDYNCAATESSSNVVTYGAYAFPPVLENLLFNAVTYPQNTFTDNYDYRGTVNTAANWVFSAYVKMNDNSRPIPGDPNDPSADFSIMLEGVECTSFTIEQLGSNFYRVSGTALTTNSGSTDNGIFQSQNGTQKGFIMSGAQLELGTIPSTLIRTSGAPITRAVDSLDINGLNISGYLNAEWSALISLRPITPNSGANYLMIGYNVNNDVTLLSDVAANGIAWKYNMAPLYKNSGSGIYNLGLMYDGNLRGYVAGVEIYSQVSSINNYLKRLLFAPGAFAKGYIRAIILFKDNLTPAEMKRLTMNQ